MKTCFLYKISLLCILYASHIDAQDEWTSMGPGNIPFYTFGIDGSYLYAGGLGSHGGIFRTTDYGENWTQVNTGLPTDASTLISIAVTDTSILAAVPPRKIFVSKDSGDTWNPVIIQSSLIWINSIVVANDPWNAIIGGGIRFKGTSGAVISSNGTDWVEVSDGLPLSGSIHSLIVRDSTIFSGTNSGVYKLEFNISSWEPSNLGMTNLPVYALGQDELYIYAGSERNGIFRSTDGENWSQINNGLETENTIFKSFAFYSLNIFAASIGNHSGVFQSNDHGEHWSSFNEGLPLNADIHALAVHGPYLFAGTDNYGVYRRSIPGFTSTNDMVDAGFENNIQIYPNPGSGKFTFSLSPAKSSTDEFNDIEIICYSPLGQLLYRKGLMPVHGEIKTNLDFSNYPDGIYMLQIQNQNKSAFKKLIINKN